jgi:uncharacterized heparinase superfamily protein
LRQRGTAAHNTLVIDRQDSSEVWSGFRVARRARPLDVSVHLPEHGHQGLSVSAAHSGYRRLRGKNIHSRQWYFVERAITITDTVTGKFESAVAYLHLHPEVSADEVDNGVVLTLAGSRQVRVTTQGGHVNLESSSWHPRFGVSIPSQRLAIALQGARLVTTISWDEPHPIA